ncbi:hypothetical protein [Streptomyces niveus]
MPAADHALDTRLDPNALDLELSLLLSSAAPSRVAQRRRRGRSPAE